MSSYLNGNTDVNIIVPDLPYGKNPQEFYLSCKKYKVLWLLHGTFGDYTDWIRKSNLERYACDKNLIVVMPSALNSEYINWSSFGMGYHMYDYLLKELMPPVYGWLPVSEAREDNFIAGLSMGGLGSFLYALNEPNKFAAAYIMSSCPREIRNLEGYSPWKFRTVNLLNNAGGLDEYQKSQYNLREVMKKKTGDNLPKFYFNCGTEDTLIYNSYVEFKNYIKDINFPAQVKDSAGYSHEWSFWDLCIKEAIELFLPTEKTGENMFDIITSNPHT